MTHDEARLLIGAAPGEIGGPLAAHLAQCPQCTLFQQQMRRMDQDLIRLLSAPPPSAAVSGPLRVGRRARRSGAPGLLALAASIVVCVGLGIVFWAQWPQTSLAAGVVSHIARESESWSEVSPLTAAATSRVLADSGVSLLPGDITVTYARSCLFDGHWVPHLVIRTASGPVTVMVLRQEHLVARQSFRQNGYSGVLVPAPAGGALAVIARGDTDMDAVTSALDPHLRWTR